MGDVISGRFGKRASVSPLEAWQIDLENLSPFEDHLYLQHLMKCPDPSSEEVANGLRLIADILDNRSGRSLTA